MENTRRIPVHDHGGGDSSARGLAEGSEYPDAPLLSPALTFDLFRPKTAAGYKAKVSGSVSRPPPLEITVVYRGAKTAAVVQLLKTPQKRSWQQSHWEPWGGLLVGGWGAAGSGSPLSPPGGDQVTLGGGRSS